MNYWPSQTELDEAVNSVNMDEAIENLSDYLKEDILVAELHPLPNGTYPLLAVHSMADIAEAYELPLKDEHGHFTVRRPRSREELEASVRSQISTKLYYAAKNAAEAVETDK